MSYLVFCHRKCSLVLTWEPNNDAEAIMSAFLSATFRKKWSSSTLTIEAVESFAVSDDGQRVVVVVKLVIELVRVRFQVSRLRRFGVVMRRVVLLTGVVCVAAFRTAAGGKKGSKMASNHLSQKYEEVLTLHCYLSLPWGVRWWLSALCRLSLELCFPSTSNNHVCPRAGHMISATGPAPHRLSATFIPRFCGFLSAASPCCRWFLIFWAGGCWDRPSGDSSRKHPSSCSGRL